MKFLPYEHIKINSALSSQEALKRLDNAIEPKRYFRLFGTGEKPYQGKVEGAHFEASRIIGYRNSFLPMIKGDIQTEINGCTIDISMQPHIFVIAFMIFWLGSVGVFFFGSLAAFISSLVQNSNPTPSMLFSSGAMFAFGYALVLGGFKFESIKSKDFFRELLESREIEEIGFTNPFNTTG